MPKLLNALYEQLSYHKILPRICNLSMKISCHASRWFISCLPNNEEKFVVAGSGSRHSLTTPPRSPLHRVR
jgi:hypothetical protein